MYTNPFWFEPGKWQVHVYTIINYFLIFEFCLYRYLKCEWFCEKCRVNDLSKNCFGGFQLHLLPMQLSSGFHWWGLDGSYRACNPCSPLHLPREVLFLCEKQFQVKSLVSIGISNWSTTAHLKLDCPQPVSCRSATDCLLLEMQGARSLTGSCKQCTQQHTEQQNEVSSTLHRLLEHQMH